MSPVSPVEYTRSGEVVHVADDRAGRSHTMCGAAIAPSERVEAIAFAEAVVCGACHLRYVEYLRFEIAFDQPDRP